MLRVRLVLRARLARRDPKAMLVRKVQLALREIRERKARLDRKEM